MGAARAVGSGPERTTKQLALRPQKLGLQYEWAVVAVAALATEVIIAVVVPVGGVVAHVVLEAVQVMVARFALVIVMVVVVASSAIATAHAGLAVAPPPPPRVQHEQRQHP